MRSRSLRAHEMGPGGASLTPSAHPSRRTVFRKLQMLDAISSCSNRRLYYTLRISARLDAHGLWAHGEIRFSMQGTLCATVAVLLVESTLDALSVHQSRCAACPPPS